MRWLYLELANNGCQILSPHRLEFISEAQNFMRDEAEGDFSEKELEDHHLYAIRQADFLWLHLPEGYIGASTAMEIGYALGQKVLVLLSSEPGEAIFKGCVTTVQSVFKGLTSLKLI